MKSRMVGHVEAQRHGMFSRATESVRADLEALCERVEQGVRAQVLDVYGLLAREYLAVLVGGGGAAESSSAASGAVRVPGHNGVLAGPERLLRAEMLPILRDAARWFANVPAGGGDASDDRPFRDEPETVRARGQSPCAGDDDDDDDNDDDEEDIDRLAATQLHEESEAGGFGRDSVVGIKSESAE